MKRTLAILTFALAQLGATAFAGGRFIGDAVGDGPYRHWFSGSVITITFDSDSQPQAPSTASTLILNAAQAWEDIACTDINFEAGTLQQVAVNWVDDSLNTIAYNDPSDLMDPGVLAATVTWFNNLNTETVNGYTWRQVTNFDIAWNDAVDGSAFGSPAQVDSPGCVGLTDMQSVALHEIGHGIGYGHPCDSGESCPDVDKVASIMFWSIGPCTNKRTPTAYDLETHSIAYGLGSVSSFSADTATGPTPLTVTFSPLTYASAAIASTTWNFGDGQTQVVTTQPFTASHSYANEGRYTVSMAIDGSVPACGGPFQQTVRKVNYITACDSLVPTFTHSVDGKRVKFHSTTDGSAAGCLQTLEWDFGDSTTSNVKDPIHDYADGGTYQVTLKAVGPGSPAGVTSAATAVKTGGKGGCAIGEVTPNVNTAAAAGALLAAVLMSVGASRRRSRG